MFKYWGRLFLTALGYKMVSLVLDKEQVELIRKTRDLLEELIETLDIMSDAELMEDIHKGEDDVKEGRARNYDEFIKELKSSRGI